MSDSPIRSRAAISILLLAVLTALFSVSWGMWRRAVTESSQNGFSSGPVLSFAAESKPLARIDQESIRVAVTGPQKQLDISIDGPYLLRPVGSSKVLSRAEKLAATTVTATGNGLKFGKTEFAVTRLEVVPSQSPSVWVNGHEYRGVVRLFRQSGGSIRAVNVLPISEYLASVVDSEMPTSFGVEARKAQAISGNNLGGFWVALGVLQAKAKQVDRSFEKRPASSPCFRDAFFARITLRFVADRQLKEPQSSPMLLRR